MVNPCRMQAAAWPRDSGQLGDHSIGMRNRLEDMAADGEIEHPVWKFEVEHVSMIET